MFRLCAVSVATSGKSPLVLRRLKNVSLGKTITAVGLPSGNTNGGGGGSGGGCPDMVEIATQLRLTRNASAARGGGIFTEPTSRKSHQIRARTLFAFFAKSKFGLSRLTGCVERA